LPFQATWKKKLDLFYIISLKNNLGDTNLETYVTQPIVTRN
jgi:hypothetical protein